MKKLPKLFATVLLCCVLALTLSACGLFDDTNGNNNDDDNNNPTPINPAPTVSYEITYSNAKVWENSIGTQWVQTIIEVKNTGTGNLYLSSGSFDLEKPDGTLVASETMVSVFPDVIAPNEKAYYYEETTLDSVSEEMELIVEVRPNVKNATIPKVRLDVKDLSLKNQQYRGLELLGRITNTTSETQNMTYISVVLFGENDTPMGHMFEIIMDDIPAGQERGFTVTSFNLPPDITSESVSRYEVVAYPLQFQF